MAIRNHGFDSVVPISLDTAVHYAAHSNRVIMYVYTLLLAIQFSMKLSIFKYRGFILDTKETGGRYITILQYVLCCDSTRTAI